ncbi:MAG: hypothetical protein KF691_12880 [Phycisphaeraceae bacterium]|nr:hypothetical protein [Phycisphaeraceae bacterium]
MNDLITRLFALKTLRPGDPGVALEWIRPIPAWGWTLVLAGAVALAWWGYRRLEGTINRRAILATLRGLSLVLVTAMISGPRLVKTEETVEKDWVVVLADRSQSMEVADVDGKSRDDQLRHAVEETKKALAKLDPERNVLWLGFDARTFDLPPDASTLPPPDGTRTLIAAALEQTLRRAASKPLSGIVLVSDGRSADEPSRSLLRQLQGRQVPVFSVALGSDEPPTRISLKRVTAPSVAFVGDFVPVTVDLEAIGKPEALRGSKIDLIDEATGKLLDSRPVPESAGTTGNATLTMMTRPGNAQEFRWVVKPVLPEGNGPTAATKNDEYSIGLRVLDRPVRVALFDGYPRWEYRYLKNLLLRERSIRSSALILSSDRRYLQEGTDPLASIPRTREEWLPFDVIVMGDVRSELFSAEQLAQIKELVAVKGAGLLWIAGPNSTPQTWRNTPLADLLPFALDDGSSGARTFAESVLVSPAPAAERLGVLRLGEEGSQAWPEILSDVSAGWNALRYAQLIDPKQLKPAAEVLAVASPSSGPIGSSGAMPLVITMRYGAGRVLYVATDEIWRWRYGRGETLPERFWLPLVRLLARESLSRSGQQAILDATPERATVDQSVQISVRLLDQSLLNTRPVSLTVRAKPESSSDIGEQSITLRPQESNRGVGEAPSGLYTGSWTFAEAGDYTIRPVDAILSGLGLSAKVEVRARDDEMREPAADHVLLAEIADATAGRVLRTDEIGQLTELLPNRQVRTAGETLSEPLWDKPIVWTLLILLLSLEWIGRRLIRLA